ncbi:putative phage abortive infection protein [Neobacillus sp. KR4-4]|uniref:putative phage abortive infection protein n=1 Tax=Neobacillus sp. KR4-4 TaxID=3344872 RepID=UPI0035C9B66A
MVKRPTENNKQENTEDGVSHKTETLMILSSIFIIVWTIFTIFLTIGNYMRNKLTFGGDLGQIGDFFSGTSTPILTFLAVLFAYFAFKSQGEQIRLQKDQAETNRIETTFFQLLDLHNQIVKSMEYKYKGGKETGRGFFKVAYKDLLEIHTKKGKERFYKSDISSSMKDLDFKHKEILPHYFRNLYQLFKWIDKNKDHLKEKGCEEFIDFVRAQLSHHEIILLYFNANYMDSEYGTNSYTGVDTEQKFINILNKYNFFKKHENEDADSILTQFKKDVENKQNTN